ncbi:MAPEG family protein [Phaeobacter sp. B1627]|uniref:MAPEG family protein n=1 Tax=Phaeobacter sp. B1627 TaxID=2583809 RepID=UPI00111A6432|nr:MAPEG family protein [Phaeobacter sp. B1627]TNJ47662.1 MAPEG family protein [Phaeobacter sp. B1627]
MPLELTALTLAALLQMFQIALMAVHANLELKPGQTLGPRDRDRMGGDLQDQVSKRTARLYRATNNHFEGLILFSIACVVVTLAEASSTLTSICAFAYLGARVLYIPAYAFGWVPWRSLIWAVGYLSTATMLIAGLA